MFSQLALFLFFGYSFISKPEKLITISPGGLKGFWMLGVASFIKDHYSLQGYSFSGASAGSWVALFLSYKHNTTTFTNTIFDDKIDRISTISLLKETVKEKIRNSFSEKDFHFSRLYVGVSSLSDQYQVKTHIYSNFLSLENALDCCIASSHIPFLTGGLITRYNNLCSYDGGFSMYPYTNHIKPVLHITPEMFEKDDDGSNGSSKGKGKGFFYHLSLFRRTKSFRELYHQGYQDAQQNKKIFDMVFATTTTS
jgi:hypothetical protein